MSHRFKVCFPSGDGNMVCQHWNGNWIVFPIGKAEEVVQTETATISEEAVAVSSK